MGDGIIVVVNDSKGKSTREARLSSAMGLHVDGGGLADRSDVRRKHECE